MHVKLSQDQHYLFGGWSTWSGLLLCCIYISATIKIFSKKSVPNSHTTVPIWFKWLMNEKIKKRLYQMLNSVIDDQVMMWKFTMLHSLVLALLIYRSLRYNFITFSVTICKHCLWLMVWERKKQCYSERSLFFFKCWGKNRRIIHNQ